MFGRYLEIIHFVFRQKCFDGSVDVELVKSRFEEWRRNDVIDVVGVNVDHERRRKDVFGVDDGNRIFGNENLLSVVVVVNEDGKFRTGDLAGQAKDLGLGGVRKIRSSERFDESEASLVPRHGRQVQIRGRDGAAFQRRKVGHF